MLGTITEKLMRKYGVQKTAVGREKKLENIVSTHFVTMTICINGTLPKRRLRKISERNYFIEGLPQNWTRRPLESFGTDMDSGGEVRMAPLDVSSLVGASIYRRSFMSQSAVLVGLAEAHFKSAEWAVSFDKGATNVVVLREISSNGMSKAYRRKYLSDSCSAR